MLKNTILRLTKITLTTMRILFIITSLCKENSQYLTKIGTSFEEYFVFYIKSYEIFLIES